MNLPNYTATGLHDAFEAVRAEAEALGVGVSGSELIGLAPKQALVDAGTFYLDRAGQSAGDDDAAIAAAAENLGLGDKGPFDPALKVVEYRVAELLSD
jgi:glutamate formiminotransferase/formiminotetrahydrofolate cyclodeaminase